MQRKLSALIASVGAGLAVNASAQSSVTLYGIVDQSVRYQTNSSPTNGSSVQLTNGAITNSRFGFKGDEDLGNGLKALFRLESGFDPQTGQLNQGGRIFGRYAYVGLSNKFGTVTLGRQGTEAFNLFGEFDPLTVGNYTANSWPFFMTIGRIDNTVAYAGKFGGLNVGTTYGFGQQPGSLSKNAYWGVRTSYDMGPLSVGGTYQEMRDLSNNVQRMWGFGAHYGIGAATLFAGYMGGNDATGTVDQSLNDPTRSVVTGSFTANPRRDMTFFTGMTYQVDPALTITGAAYYDDIKNVNGIADNPGKRYTGVLLAEYALSKRTQVYATVDYDRVTGGAFTEMPGSGNQTGVAAGICHLF
jgi:predicted porin